MLFPNMNQEHYDDRDKGILQRMSHFYAESISINQSFWGEAATDQRFESGDQTLWNDLYANLPANRRRQFNFNRIKRVVNMISGHQRRNRRSSICIPVMNGDAETASQFNKILLWNNQQEQVLSTISDAFHGALITGMNLLQVWVDYRSDMISGNIKVDNCSYNSFLMDPFFRKADLSDCNAIWKRSFLTKRECCSLMPSEEDLIMSLSANDTRDGKFQFMPENYNYGMKNLMTYDEFYYRDYRKQKMLHDTKTGEVFEWKSNDVEGLGEFLRLYPQVAVSEQDIPTVRVAIVIQGKVVYDDVNPLGIDRYPFVPVFAYYTPQLPEFNLRIQGVVRGLRDAQYLYNRRKIIELDINSGWIYKEDALVNPKDVFQSGQGRGLALKDTAQMTDVQQIQSARIDPSMVQLSESLANELQQISGVNEELLGSAVDEKAGILSMLRQGSGLTTLQGLFDQLDQSQHLLEKIRLEIIQNNFTPGKVKRIIEEEPTPQFYNKAFGQYDVAIEDGLNTTTQRQMQLLQLLQLKEAGVPIPDDVIIDACTVEDKKKLMESINNARQQQEQMQQQQMQSEIAERMARAELAKSRSMADQGLGLERLSRIQENKALAVERQAAAARDESAATLDMIRAMKELEGVDLEHINTLVSMLAIIKEQEQQVAERAKQTASASESGAQSKLQAALK
jgi:hypothetical protein